MIELKPGITPEHLAELYSDELVSRICDDDQPMYPVFHELATYLSAFVSGRFVGAYLAIRYSACEYEVHTLLMKPATKASRELGRQLLDWCFSDKNVLRVTGYIREGLQSAINHCLKMGFKHEGFRREAVRCSGVPRGIHIMGITRTEWAHHEFNR